MVLRCLEKEPSRGFPDAHSLEQAMAACAAEQWTEEQASLWWREHANSTATDLDLHSDVPTQVTV